jgi:sarcosine oxidase delta subunit
MLLITCPACGIAADESAFAHGGGAELPPDIDAAQSTMHGEYWCCEAGCGTWFGLARDIASQRLLAAWLLPGAATR